MRTILFSSIAAATLSAVVFAFAQPPPRTIEDRVASLESALATLETRFGLETSRQPNLGGETGQALAGRVTSLERSLDLLATEVQRVQRLADTAARDAANAQQLARVASMRAR
jgi:hypothetical protein